MKKLLFTMLLIVLFAGCDSDDAPDLIVQNATIFIDQTEVDNCLYSIKTENNELFTTDNLPGEYSESTFDAQITYRVTKERGRCGFGGSLIKIEILDLVKS